MIRTRSISTLLACFILSNCTGVQLAENFREPSELDREQSLLYIYRQETVPVALAPEISIDEKSISNLPIYSYIELKIKPGEHTIRADWPLISGMRDQDISFTSKPNNMYYVRIGKNISADSLLFMPGVMVMAVPNGDLSLLDNGIAQEEITECRKIILAEDL